MCDKKGVLKRWRGRGEGVKLISPLHWRVSKLASRKAADAEYFFCFFLINITSSMNYLLFHDLHFCHPPPSSTLTQFLCPFFCNTGKRFNRNR